MDHNRSVWDRLAMAYDKRLFCKEKTNCQIAELMMQDLRRDMTVLEIACGNGQLAVAIAPCVRHYEATDISREMIQQSKRQPHSSRLYFSVQDAMNLPYEDEMFDAVIIANALNYMPDSDHVLDSIRHILKKEGLLIAPICISDGNSMRRSDCPVYHTWTPETYLEYLKEHGFDVAKSRMLAGDCKILYAEAKRTAITYVR